MESSLHFPGSNSLCSMALWPQDALPSPKACFPLIPVLACARPILAPPPCRCLTAAPGSLAHCASHARGVGVGCAQAMDSARTGSWAVGSATATRASMERPVRCVSWAATGPTALEVRTGEGAGMVGILAEDSGRSWRHPSRGRTEAMGNSSPPSSTSSVSLCPWAVPGGATRGWQLCL